MRIVGIVGTGRMRAWLALGLLLLSCSSQTPVVVPTPGPVAEPEPEPAAPAVEVVTDTGVPDAGPPDTGPPMTADGFRVCPQEAQWPEGMACVAGGAFTLGDAHGRRDERAPGEVIVDTFYMDRYEVTNARYETCIEAGTCQRPMPFRRFMGDDQPMVAVSWFDAGHFCEMLGRRLPTEAEWERAASGPEHTRYPWGDEPDENCERAVVKNRRGEACGRNRTAPVGSRPAGYFGLYDMAGNVHEWVQDWYSPCLRGCADECGDACFGRNPRGPCDGGLRCAGRTLRSVRGGSWYWALRRARATARRGAFAPNRGPHRFGFRCARALDSPAASSDAPTEDAGAPAVEGTSTAASAQSFPQQLDPPPSVGPLPEETRRALAEIVDEGTRPPGQHYYRSNEWRQDLLIPHLEGLGGVVIGVGADQNYTLAAMARAELLIVVDYDPFIPWIHRILGILIGAAETPEALIRLFDEGAERSTGRLLRAALGDHPRAARIERHWRRRRADWQSYLERVRGLERDGQPFSWLADPQMYAYVRAMHQQGRIVAHNGDVTGERTLRTIARVLRRLQYTVRVLYLSNAEQFFTYTDGFIRNMGELPTDDRSIVLRMIRHRRIEVADGGRWHYMVHSFPDFLSRLGTGAYRRSFSFTADLLAAGAPHLGQGISTMTSETPRATLREVQERRRRR